MLNIPKTCWHTTGIILVCSQTQTGIQNGQKGGGPTWIPWYLGLQMGREKHVGQEVLELVNPCSSGFSHSSVNFLGLAICVYIPLTHILWPSQEVWSVTGWLYSKREWTENIPEGEQSRTLSQKLLRLPWHRLKRYRVSLMPYFINGAPKSLQMMIAAMKLKDAYSLGGKLWPT